MRRAAVLGSPVGHSLSPALHRAAYRALGLTDWRYDAIEVAEADLPGFLADLDESWAGLSLTMPLKRAALGVADAASPLAGAVGAANTLIRRDGGWYADNTDVGGMVDALGAPPPDADPPVVLGAGGTATSALAALAELGRREPLVLVRDTGRAADLLAAADRLGVRPVARAPLTDRAATSAPLLISTIPAGAADQVASTRWDRRPGVVFDVVYDPWPTELALAAERAGRRVIGGADLLLYQAVRQVRLMTGRAGVPVDAMRAALPAARR